MTRQEILASATKITAQDRNIQYGAPEDNFLCIANLWNAYLLARGKTQGGLNRPLTPDDIAILNILQKVSRMITSPDKADHWIDIAGYAACGGECATKQEELQRFIKHKFQQSNDLSSPRCAQCGLDMGDIVHK